jgi:hypothetical protein
VNSSVTIKKYYSTVTVSQHQIKAPEMEKEKYYCIVDTLLTHTSQDSPRGMGYEGVWFFERVKLCHFKHTKFTFNNEFFSSS